MKTSCLLFALIYCTGLLAQSKPTVTVRAGKRVRDAFTSSQAFYYPEFKIGQVLFRNGMKAEAKLNYSQLVDEVHFIDPGVRYCGGSRVDREQSKQVQNWRRGIW